MSSDDAHHFQELGLDRSNPGRGWVMVRSEELSPDAISEAMYRGDFYATSGVMLEVAENESRRISIGIDKEATERELSSSFVVGHLVEEGEVGFRIQFIGPEGRVLQETDELSASFRVNGELSYTRAKAIYTRRVEGGFERFYAWMQPVFTDGRTHLAER